jgi:hypothetical protein
MEAAAVSKIESNILINASIHQPFCATLFAMKFITKLISLKQIMFIMLAMKFKLDLRFSQRLLLYHRLRYNAV